MKTHYETLGLEETCSGKEIREAFVKLSKEVHPDRNPDNPDCHKAFVRINEAYSVLSKTDQRQRYDSVLQQSRYISKNSHAASQSSSWVETNAPFGRTVEWRDETIWSMRDRTRDNEYKQKPYYGIKGVNKVPNSYIAVGCIAFMLAGAVFHYFAVKKSSGMAIQELDKWDKINGDIYLAARNQAMANGNKIQLEKMREKLGTLERK